MNFESSTVHDADQHPEADDIPDLYAGMPADIRDGLTDHFLALMGAEPLQAHERLVA